MFFFSIVNAVFKWPKSYLVIAIGPELIKRHLPNLNYSFQLKAVVQESKIFPENCIFLMMKTRYKVLKIGIRDDPVSSLLIQILGTNEKYDDSSSKFHFLASSMYSCS